MADYAPGMRVIVRGEEWLVKKVETNSMGNKSLHCVGISTLIKDKEAIFLDDLEKPEIVDPAKINFVVDDSSHFINSRLFIESRLRQKIPTDNNLHIGHLAAMDPLEFQLDPTKLALKKYRQRILIADTVGLGKTLEAGILLSELIARGKGRRILVVTVKSMMTQFQKEMWNRFAIPLVRLDSKAIHKIRAELPTNHNPFFYYDKTIVSVDTLKRDIEYRTHLEQAYWDVIVIDEAHNVAERGGHQAQRARLAKLLAGRSDSMIMLSATPHDGKAESFASLMKMLDPTSIADIHKYTKEDIKGLYIRRFKKDVKDQISEGFKERKVSIEKCRASSLEEQAFEIFADMNLEMDSTRKNTTSCLFKTSLEKSLFSSPAACIKSIEERLKKLNKKYEHGEFGDIAKLEELRKALINIKPADFSRYQRLLELLKDKNYGWHATRKDDRLVIFTERIETMKYLAANLRNDLKLSEEAVVEISGNLSDIEQQAIVEDFCKTEAPVRILVASDVASEGLNLHHLSHRMIHFDIPWSLMVFQQRNGRIDRYGQKKQPDIRYFKIDSNNQKIKGDTRILEILAQKEQQALENIGDPAMIFDKYDVEGEENEISNIIENGADAEAFEARIDETIKKKSLSDIADDFFFGDDDDENAEPVILSDQQKVTDKTLFSDGDYIFNGIKTINSSIKKSVEPWQKNLTFNVEGYDIFLTDEMKRRLKALIPSEVMPQGDILRASTDKKFCIQEMAKSMQKNMNEEAWPDTQYLWKLHPIYNWLNDKAGVLFKRDEAPVCGLHSKLHNGEVIFLVTGSIPNQKSTPLVDEWFGLRFIDGKFDKELSLQKVIEITGIDDKEPINPLLTSEKTVQHLLAMREDVVKEAKHYMQGYYEDYKKKTDPLINEELDKLANLQEKHVCYQLSLFEDERRQNAKKRETEELFDRFEKWVKETLTIENNPYIKIMAVFTEAAK